MGTGHTRGPTDGGGGESDWGEEDGDDLSLTPVR
ncbi:hypothetical protein SAMN05444920_117119 [Nonomuraea solani]|uniref:Uncharacterized protein n=1 Tax=Nonomuraea solani TaxID=1144553 RepID=A0A1H6ES56_9ACTN|nr:hypothetical protein SAMN05444920_117119 [Nonomuraea solani]